MLNHIHFNLLGDSGYTLSPILLTPFANPVAGSPQAKFNDALRKTRCNIEQCFGILSNVFRCISRSRKLCYKPKKVAKFVTVCAILHNFRKLHGWVVWWNFVFSTHLINQSSLKINWIECFYCNKSNFLLIHHYSIFFRGGDEDEDNLPVDFEENQEVALEFGENDLNYQHGLAERQRVVNTYFS